MSVVIKEGNSTVRGCTYFLDSAGNLVKRTPGNTGSFGLYRDTEKDLLMYIKTVNGTCMHVVIGKLQPNQILWMNENRLNAGKLDGVDEKDMDYITSKGWSVEGCQTKDIVLQAPRNGSCQKAQKYIYSTLNYLEETYPHYETKQYLALLKDAIESHLANYSNNFI